MTIEELKTVKDEAYMRYVKLQQQYNEELSNYCTDIKYVESTYDDCSIFAKVIKYDNTSVDVVMVDTDGVYISNEILTYQKLEEDYAISTKEKFEEAFNWAVNKLKEDING